MNTLNTTNIVLNERHESGNNSKPIIVLTGGSDEIGRLMPLIKKCEQGLGVRIICHDGPITKIDGEEKVNETILMPFCIQPDFDLHEVYCTDSLDEPSWNKMNKGAFSKRQRRQ